MKVNGKSFLSCLVLSSFPRDILPEILAQDNEFRFRAASPPFIDAYLRTFPSSHRYPICTPSPGFLDLIFLYLSRWNITGCQYYFRELMKTRTSEPVVLVRSPTLLVHGCSNAPAC
jgi:hypothetical protein